MANLFWDSSVFYAFLDGNSVHDTSGIEQYLYETRNGEHRIYASSLVLAEVIPSAITRPNVGSLQDFIDDLESAVTIVTPSPDVMHRAARLKDLPYQKANSRGRRLGTPDAIILASCLEIMEMWNINIDAFHTFDDGKTRGPQGRMIPLISYQDWCEGFATVHLAVAEPVIRLNRCKPIHPRPRLVSP